MSSGESLCMRLPTSSVVLKTFFGTEVAADKRLIIVVFCSKSERGLPHRICLPDRSDVYCGYNPVPHFIAAANMLM